MVKSKLNLADLYNKKVFLRADLSVPIKNDAIFDDFKLRAIVPTLDLLREKSAYIVLGTSLENKYSTKILADWLNDKGYNICFAKDLKQASELIKNMNSGSIVMLENLKLYKEEKNYSQEFAQTLYNLAPDYFVNDAFGLIDKEYTSVALLPKLYENKDKSIGLLMEKELSELSRLKNPNPPFVVILGGDQIKEKLELIKDLLDKANTIMLLPPLAFTFLKAKGKEVGKYLINQDKVNNAKEILEKSLLTKTNILTPDDFLVAEDNVNGKLSYKKNMDKNDFGIAIGNETLVKYKVHLSCNNANTIFFTGIMGFLDMPKTIHELKTLLQTVAQSNAYTVIGGGESVAAVNLFNLAPDFNFLSTSSNACLAYISGQSLPGLINTIS